MLKMHLGELDEDFNLFLFGEYGETVDLQDYSTELAYVLPRDRKLFYQETTFDQIQANVLHETN